MYKPKTPKLNKKCDKRQNLRLWLISCTLLSIYSSVIFCRHTSKAAALLQAQQQHQQHQQQAQQQKQQAVMSALGQQLVDSTPPAATSSSTTTTTETNNELQIVDENGEPVNWQDDPNEPRYCLCNQVSYGEMVGCDNDDVSLHGDIRSNPWPA